MISANISTNSQHFDRIKHAQSPKVGSPSKSTNRRRGRDDRKKFSIENVETRELIP